MRGQITIEAVMVTGIIFVLILSILGIGFERWTMARDIGETGELKMVGELLATSINNVYVNGEGFRIYLGADILNYTKLSSPTVLGGVGLNLPITINRTGKVIVLQKNMTKTGLSSLWETTISIIPESVYVENDLTTYNETTILNNGSSVIIYTSAGNFNYVE